MPRRLRAALAGLLLVTVLAPTAAVAGDPPPRISLGVAMLPYDSVPTLNGFRDATGHDPAIWMIWSDWGGTNKRFPPVDDPLLTAARERGIAIMVTWQPAMPNDRYDYRFRYERIAKGRYDRYIRTFARAARDHGGRVLLRFAHEMNAPWFPWGIGVSTNTPKNFRAAWRRISNLFKEEGATNVRFVWSPYLPCGACAPYAKVYPGNRFVKYVGFTGFNWGGPNRWRSMQKSFQKGMDGMAETAPTKKVIVTETGVGPSPKETLTRSGWITKGYPKVYATWPSLVGIVYFNVDMRHAGHPDWRLQPYDGKQADDGSLAAYAAIAADPRFQAAIP